MRRTKKEGSNATTLTAVRKIARALPGNIVLIPLNKEGIEYYTARFVRVPSLRLRISEGELDGGYKARVTHELRARAIDVFKVTGATICYLTYFACVLPADPNACATATRTYDAPEPLIHFIGIAFQSRKQSYCRNTGWRTALRAAILSPGQYEVDVDIESNGSMPVPPPICQEHRQLIWATMNQKVPPRHAVCLMAVPTKYKRWALKHDQRQGGENVRPV